MSPDRSGSPRRGLAALGLALGLALLLQGCGAGRAVPAGPFEPGWTQQGVASWYGPGFHGRPTASGETFDMEAMTAAHPSLPLGTRIRVTVLATGRRTDLRVNDRGPFRKGRILDVSRAAARRLGFLGRGTARVRVEVLSLPRDCWELQVGAFAREVNATALRDRLLREGEPVRMEPGPEGLTRVIAGPYPSRAAAEEVRSRHGGDVGGCPR